MLKELITVNDGQAVVSSLDIAEHFGRDHKNVTQSIQNLVAENSAAKSLFFETTYENRGKQYPMYLMNRDGFSLLCMGFTGAKALEWKLKYIDAFNKMEKTLAEQATKPMTTAEMFQLQAQINVEQERRLAAIEANQQKVIEACSVPAVGRDEWQENMKKYLSGLCEEYGMSYPVMYDDLYSALERKVGCDLDRRQSNMRKRLKAAGATYNLIFRELASLSLFPSGNKELIQFTYGLDGGIFQLILGGVDVLKVLVLSYLGREPRKCGGQGYDRKLGNEIGSNFHCCIGHVFYHFGIFLSFTLIGRAATLAMTSS